PDEAGPLQMAVPGIAEGTARVAAGRRVFGGAWEGGVPPYLVTLSGGQGDGPLHEARVEHHQLVQSSERHSLLPGGPEVKVVDGTGAVTKGRFSVVPGETIPSPPPGTVPEFLQPNDSVTMTAAWLLDQSKETKIYWYEAYLRALPVKISDADSKGGDLI